MSVKISCNWTRCGGCSFIEALQLKNAEDVFLRPDLDDLVKDDKAILLNKENCSDFCELTIELKPDYKMQSLSLVCNVNKVEIFQGYLKEYLETIYGTIQIDGDCEDEFKTYRYDVELEKSGVTQLAIKFLAPNTVEDVCLFGMQLQIAPNPNGVTTLAPNCINFENVQTLLNDSPKSLTPASERCKQLFELIAKSNSFSQGRNDNNTHEHNINIKNQQNLDTTALQNYIDHKLSQMEERLNKRLELMEERQTGQLNCLFKMFEKLECNR